MSATRGKSPPTCGFDFIAAALAIHLHPTFDTLGSVNSGNVSHGPRTGDFNHWRCSTVRESDHESTASSLDMTIPTSKRGLCKCLARWYFTSRCFRRNHGYGERRFSCRKEDPFASRNNYRWTLFVFTKRKQTLTKKGRANVCRISWCDAVESVIIKHKQQSTFGGLEPYNSVATICLLKR